MFTTKELQGIAKQIASSASAVIEARGIVLRVRGEGDELLSYERGELTAEIGNNTAQVLVEAFHEMLPEIDAELQASARSMIWANEIGNPNDRIGRAGILGAIEGMPTFITRVIGATADLALEELERRLFALFLAARHLRRLPGECQFSHRIDPTGACERCGERPEQ